MGGGGEIPVCSHTGTTTRGAVCTASSRVQVTMRHRTV